MSETSSCIVLEGKAGSGKTSSLRALAEAAAAAGHRVAVVLQPDLGRNPDGIGRGFTMEYLSGRAKSLSSESLALARERKPEDGPATGSIIHGRFVFDAKTFSKAEAFVHEALDAPERLALLGLDEIGKLELSRHEGLRDCLDRAIAAAALDHAPGLLVLTARSLNAPDILRLLQASDLRVTVLRAEDREAFFRAAFAALAG